MFIQGKSLWAILCRRLRTRAPGKNAARIGIAFTARRRRRFYHALHLSGLWR